jgi:PAS domain-containing protein
MSRRPQLVALPGYADRQPDVQFCGHCGRAAAIDIAAPASRVCTRCELGLLIGAPPELAPAPSDAFLLVDSTLSICGVSALAEELLGLSETEAVNRHVNELLVPADAEVAGPGDLVNLLIRAARGEGEVYDVVLRPTDEYGIRYWARIGPCGPPRAALLVLGDGTTLR